MVQLMRFQNGTHCFSERCRPTIPKGSYSEGPLFQ